MKALRGILVTAAVVGAISGCSASVNLGGPEPSGPSCLAPLQGRPSVLNGTLVLAAQSVPSASRIPCLRRLPAGWTFHSFDARSGESRLTLDLGDAYQNALLVTLTHSCDVRLAEPVPSDRAGLRRYDDVRRSAVRYTGERYYLFPGGCITFRFDVRGVAAGQAATTVARSVDVVTRNVLRAYVRLYSRGRLHLDPTPGS